jgi:hypothetical protein
VLELAEGLPETERRLFPIGTFPEKEVVALLTDPLCAENISIDEFMGEWRSKSRAFEAEPVAPLDVLESELLPLHASEETLNKIESVLTSYRYFLPITFDLRFVPISKLITPQVSISYDQALSVANEANGPLSDDTNAALCLGSPIPSHPIEGAYLGSQKGPPFQTGSSYVYQFSSNDPSLRVIPMMPFKPLRDMNLATEGAHFSYDVKAIPIAVGLGMPVVHVLKVPRGVDGATGKTRYRTVIVNGIHRAFRLAEIGNTHMAALVQTMDYEEVPNPLVDVPRDRAFSPKPLTISTLRDDRVSRLIKWKKSKRVIRVQVAVSQEVSYIA